MSTEEGLPRMAQVRRNIERLRSRLDYLAEKRQQREYAGREFAFIAEEMEALTWALPVLEAEWDALARLRRFVMETEGRSEEQIADHERTWEECRRTRTQRTAAGRPA